MDKLPEIEENVVESIEENVEEEEPLPDVPEIKEKEIISQDEIFTSKKKTEIPEIKKVKKPKLFKDKLNNIKYIYASKEK